MATDAAGNVYVADTSNNRIQKFTGTGTYLTQWGSYGSGNGQFDDPIGVATDAAGNVYVADTDNHRIQKFTGTGTYLTQWGSSGSGNGQFAYPAGVATDAAGNVYVADSENYRVESPKARDFQAFDDSSNPASLIRRLRGCLRPRPVRGWAAGKGRREVARRRHRPRRTAGTQHQVDVVADRHDAVVEEFSAVAGSYGFPVSVNASYTSLVERLGPQVDVVAGRIAVAREDVAERRRRMAQHDLLRHADLGHGRLERLDIDALVGRGRHMKLHVVDGVGEILDGVEALIEVIGLQDLVDQFLRNRFAGLVVHGIGVSTSGVASQYSFTWLGNSTKSRLTLVPASVGYFTFESRPCSAWPNSWNIVLASSQEISTGSPGLALMKFALLETTGVTSVLEPLLRAVFVHPCAGVLAGPRVGVEVP